MKDYFARDLSEFKHDILTLLARRRRDVGAKGGVREGEVAESLREMLQLGAQHSSLGPRYKVDGSANPLDLVEQYSEVYESIVKEANSHKAQLREEAGKLEAELRALRNVVADKQVEAKGIEYIVSVEEQLK